jgi:non-ribosomal peptide synthetase component F
VDDGRGSVVHFTVPAPVATAFADLGKQYRTTPFASLLTALTTLLARHSGQWDIPVGTPVAGRDRPEIEGVVGFFLNSLVLRCDLDGGMSFVQALERVREVCHDAFAHQNLPFEVLVDSVTPERDLSRTPIYQVAFDLHDESFNDAGSRPEELATLQEVWNLAHTDLTLYLRRQPDGTMAGSLEYATALFEPATAERLVEHFQRLLGAIAADPHLRLDAADLLSAEERHDLLSNWATAPTRRWSAPFPSCSWPRRPGRRTPWPWRPTASRSATRSWTRGPTGRPTTSGRWASARRPRSGCCWTGEQT